jgi:hypothetical protein
MKGIDMAEKKLFFVDLISPQLRDISGFKGDVLGVARVRIRPSGCHSFRFTLMLL